MTKQISKVEELFNEVDRVIELYDLKHKGDELDTAIINLKRGLGIYKPTKYDIAVNQVTIQNEMQSAGFNVVNCGSCGSVMLMRQEEEVLNCLCGSEMDLSDCPDYWYEGQELNEEFNEEETEGIDFPEYS